MGLSNNIGPTVSSDELEDDAVTPDKMAPGSMVYLGQRALTLGVAAIPSADRPVYVVVRSSWGSVMGGDDVDLILEVEDAVGAGTYTQRDDWFYSPGTLAAGIATVHAKLAAWVEPGRGYRVVDQGSTGASHNSTFGREYEV